MVRWLYLQLSATGQFSRGPCHTIGQLSMKTDVIGQLSKKSNVIGHLNIR